MSSDTIAVYEQYLFAKDKKEFLDGCKNSSQIKQYIRIAHLLNTGTPFEQVDRDLLNQWSRSQCYGDKQGLIIKDMLLQVYREEDAAKRKKLMEEFNNKFFGYSFNDERQQVGAQSASGPNTGAAAALKTAFTQADLDEMATNLKIRTVEDSVNGSIGFGVAELGQALLKRIDLLKVKNWSLFEQILNSVDNFAYSTSIVDALINYKSYMRGRDQYSYHWQIPEHLLQKCTLKQLDTLGDKNSDTFGEFYFRKVQFQKKFYNELNELNEVECAKKQREILKDLLTKAGADTKRNNDGIFSALNEALLFNGYELQEYEEPILKSYILKPVFRHGEFLETYWKSISSQSSSWKELINYRPVNIPQPDMNELFRAYLNKVITSDEMIKVYSNYFNSKFLTGLLITNKVTNGGNLEEYKAFFGDSAATDLENKKNLEIIRKNKRHFKRGEDVKLILDIKNVPELVYKIFEIDTETYYKKNNSEISDNLDLDGLIPEKIHRIAYSQKKHHQHTEEFSFSEITKKDKGVFIIEFVGNGISSRAVVKKGSLNLLVQEHFQGYKLFVIDEEKKVCTGTKTGIYIDGKFNKINEKGFVLMPFNENYVNTQAIVTHDGFNCLANVSMSNENYRLGNAVIFNEESIVSGRKLKIVVKNRLFLNEVPITLKKFEEFNAEVQLTNYDNITNYKHFKDIKLSDSEDLILELIVPPMLTRLEVRINGKLKNLLNKDVNLAASENITISRDEGADRFVTVHLNKNDAGYYAELRGKNGEAIPNRQIVVQLWKNFGNFSFVKEIYTSAAGIATIGKIEDIRQIQLRSSTNLFMARTFSLDPIGTNVDINQSFNICKGDQLVLPSNGQALIPQNFELLQMSQGNNAPLKSWFDHIKEEKDTGLLVISGLEKGSYIFRYYTTDVTEIYINVHDAKRWLGNAMFLELPHEILEIKNESKMLSVSNLKKSDDGLSFKVSSNSLQNTRVHVFGYHHYSQLLQVLRNKSNALTPSLSQQSTPISKKNNSYRSNRVLSDEHVYVNERKSKPTFIGNTLDKPSILLHREKVRETKDDEEVLNKGADFAADNFKERAMKKMMAPGHYGAAALRSAVGGSGLLTQYQVLSQLDYLSECGHAFVNLHPTEKGIVHLNPADYKNCSYLLVNVSDNASNIFYPVEVGQSGLSKIDLRVATAKEQGLVYSEDFFATAIAAAVPGKIADLANTSNYMVEDMSSLQDVLLVIAGGGVDKTELQKWKFLVSWAKLSEEEKFKKLEEYGGHELHIFTFLRDGAFFEKHVKPMLKYKAKKELIDHLLIDDKEHYQGRLRAEEFQKLSVLEAVLLAYRLRDTQAELCKEYLESLRKRQEVKLENNDRKKALYESILASKKIEEPPAPVQKIAMKPQEQMVARESMAMPKMSMAAPMMARRAAPAPMAMKKSLAAHRDVEMECAAPMKMMECDDLIDIGDESAEPVKIEKYQKKGAAFEFKERQEYFKGQFRGLQANKFWLRVVESIVEKNKPLILGEEIIEMNASSLELILTLAFTDLPFTRGTIDTKVDGSALAITSTENLLIFCKKMEERKTDPLNMELVISQKFYDPEDKYVYDEKDPTIYTIKEVREYLTAKIYEARIAFTNVGESSCSIKLITQIPQGAMPVNKLEFFKINDINIGSMTTQVVSFKFYFPSIGAFKYYPATIMKNNRFVVAARYGNDLKVVSEYTKDNKVLETLQDILNYGTIDDIINFMAQKNIFNDKIFSLAKVKWIFKSSPENYKRAVNILKSKYFYDPACWAYSIHHGDLLGFKDLISIRVPEIIQDSQYLKIGDLEFDKFEPLEYDPLINPRAHDISEKKHNILNKAFKETYERFLKYCIERGNLSEREKVLLVAYLVLQDRIQEALEKIKEIDENKILGGSTLQVQYEYLKAYLSIYTDGPKYDIARKTAEKYYNFADLSWRKRFREISKQIAEHDKGMVEKAPEEKKPGVQEKTNLELADKSEYLSLELKENFQLAITHKNISRLSISFYKLEMEILFSNDPFLEKDIMNFVSVNPNHLMKFKVTKSGEFKTNIITIPEPLQKDSLFIQVKAKDKFEILKSFNSHLRVHTIEDYGLLNVCDLSGKCLNSVYVKCFSKKKDGTVKFYKDGYTDFRGSFDFASLNSDSLNDIDKFGLFVYSQQHGSVILTAKPPSQVGRIVKDEESKVEVEEEEEDEDFKSAPLLK